MKIVIMAVVILIAFKQLVTGFIFFLALEFYQCPLLPAYNLYDTKGIKLALIFRVGKINILPKGARLFYSIV